MKGRPFRQSVITFGIFIIALAVILPMATGTKVPDTTHRSPISFRGSPPVYISTFQGMASLVCLFAGIAVVIYGGGRRDRK